MLGREQAQERLRAFAADRDRPTGGAQPASDLGTGLLAWAGDPRAEERLELGRELDASDHAFRVGALASACPALAEPLARWWEWQQHGTFQTGWDRRGFRSSRSADGLEIRTWNLWHLLRLGRDWPQDVEWFATWLSHVDDYTGALGGLLASEISAGRDDIADILSASAAGSHPISGTTRTGLAALLGCDRPERWDQVVALLRAAGRQEGLRSAVLESVDLATPDAFARVLDVVVADDLVRFAGTVRAVAAWFGEEVTVRTADGIPAVLGELSRALVDPTVAEQAGTPAQTFVRLTALAMHDVHRAIPRAAALLAQDDAGLRHAAARALAEFGVPESRAALRPALADPDLTVYTTAVSAWPPGPFARVLHGTLDDLGVEALLERVRTLGAERTIDTGIIGARPVPIGATHAADVILANLTAGPAPAEAVAAASAGGRADAVRLLAVDATAHRSALFGFVTDRSSMVRSVAVAALDRIGPPTSEEAQLLHEALRRQASDVRQFAMTMLLRQSPDAVSSSVAVLAAGSAAQVRAADELRTAVAAQEADDGFPPALRPMLVDRTPAVRPDPPPAGHFDRFHPGCRRVIASLRAWLSEHADVEVESEFAGVELLSNVRWLPPGRGLPLPDVVGPWWERTAPTLTDGGVELVLLVLGVPDSPSTWARTVAATVTGQEHAPRSEFPVLWEIVVRLAAHAVRPSWTDLALDAASTARYGLPLSELSGPVETMARLGGGVPVDPWGDPVDARDALADPAELLPLAELTRDQLDRVWRLARFVDEPEGAADVDALPRVREQVSDWRGDGEELVPDRPWRRWPSTELICRAVDAGVAGRGDLLDALVAHIAEPAGTPHAGSSCALDHLSARRPPEWGRSSVLQAVVGELREAAVASELTRGDLPGPLSRTARRLRSATGIASVTRVLAALGSRPFARANAWADGRESALSHLVRIHGPGPDDTAVQLSAAFAAAGIEEQRAVEFGVYAPQWAGLVEGHLGWAGFESAVWWLHAHTTDESWAVDPMIREAWVAAVALRTPLDAVDLERGATDVAWFRAMIAELGPDRFGEVLSAARYAASAGGHKRAELFAAALLGGLDEAELVARIRAKRHQDSVRALGLLPLDGRDDPALLRRYELLAGFVATDRTSGAQRRASEATAVAIGLENLARSAGYRDPGRLTWAMEAEAVRDLVAGPVVVREGELTVTLSLDDAGVPRLRAERAGRALKSVPAAAAKVRSISGLKERAAELRRQSSRMRRSLEAACVTGDAFEPAEFADLLGHPVLAPQLRTLVVVSDEGVLGFPTAHPRVLLGPGGERRPLDGSAVRIAHPVDLLDSGEWPDLQHEAFSAQHVQPFRQLFRELYLPTSTESGDGPSSRRYAGHQVEARRAAGIFGSRGWVADFEVGFGRTFHAEKLTVWCSLLGGFGTPAEVEDATIDEVTFVRTGSDTVVPIEEVPRRLFSEVMRDLDLVVSVAHAGGVDPESSGSTIEMRRRLVEETAEMLGLDNVEATEHHARIRGTLGRYSVQLGSGVVHRLPGNAVCIIPVSAQHRGRVFLPFADDDPRTAEVISKVLLLARDDRIQDPTILEQLV